jgi:hypothetical protein
MSLLGLLSCCTRFFGHNSFPQEEPDLTGLITAVDEAKAYYQSQEKAIESIKTTARAIFGSASLVVSLLGALQLFSKSPRTSPPWVSVAAIISVVVFYILAIYFSLLSQMPVSFVTPVKMGLAELDSAYVGKGKENVLKQQLVNYLNAIDGNRKAIEERKRWVKYSAMAFISTVVLLLVTIFFV